MSQPPSSAAAAPAEVATVRAGRGLRHSMRAFRHRDFAVFWTGALISNTGSWLQNMTIPFVLYQLTASKLWIGLSTFAQFLPGVLLGPAGGSLADRFDRRKVLVVTQSLMALAALGLWIGWVLGARSPVMIVLLVAISGTIGGLNVPSWQAFVPFLVPREDLLSAITLNSLQFNAARALGPAAAGLVLASLGPGAAFLLNAVSFLCVLGALAFVRKRETGRRVAAPDGGVLRQFGQALRYSSARPGILIGIGVAFFIALLGNPITQFTVVYVQDVYHLGKVAFGFLAAAMGIGAAAAAPLVSGWDEVLRRGSIVRFGLPLYGGAIVVFGLSGQFWVGFLGLFLAGAGFLAVVSATNTAVQIIVADALRGRVIAARVMSFTLAAALGGLIEGWLADHIGVRPTVAGAGALLFTLAVVLALRPALLARLDDPPDVTTGSAEPARPS